MATERVLLPTALLPTHYKLELHPDLSTLKFECEEEVSAKFVVLITFWSRSISSADHRHCDRERQWSHTSLQGNCNRWSFHWVIWWKCYQMWPNKLQLEVYNGESQIWTSQSLPHNINARSNLALSPMCHLEKVCWRSNTVAFWTAIWPDFTSSRFHSFDNNLFFDVEMLAGLHTLMQMVTKK